MLEGGEENDEGFAVRVLRFDILGNYMGQLGVKDKLSNGYKPVYNIRHNEINQTLFLEYSDGYREYNISGDFLAFYPGIKEKVIYNQHLWSVDNFPENRNSYFNLIRTNFDLQNREVIQMPYYKISEEWKNFVKGIIGQYSISNNELYFTNGIDNTIYLIRNNFLFPKYKVEFTDLSLTTSFLSVIQKKVIFGHFVKYGYWHNGGQYDFLYDTQTGKSFNILYFDKNGKRSGIMDDIYNRGPFSINPTNQDNCIYFTLLSG